MADVPRDQAAESATPETAWALWFLWRGGRDLVAHVARRAAQLAGAPDAEAATSIELHVGADMERFGSVPDFLEYATVDGIRRFAALVIAVTGADMAIRVTIARRPTDELPWLSEGVLIEVEGSPGRIGPARDTLAAAVSRGKLLRKAPSATGDTAASLTRLAAERRRKHRLERAMRWTARVLPIAWSLFLAVVVVQKVSEGTSGEPSTAVAAVAGAAAGLLVVPLLTLAYPNVVISDVTRVRLLLNVTSALPIGALVGLASKALG
jgi:hypothetical protein